MSHRRVPTKVVRLARDPVVTPLRPGRHPPPTDLAPAEAKHWNEILESYQVEGPAALEILRMACSAKAHVRFCDEKVAAGVTSDGKINYLREASVARNSYLNCLRALRLNVGPRK